MRWTSVVGTMAMAVGWVLAPGPAAAQQVEDYDLPASVADEIIAFFNAPGTLRMEAPATIGADEILDSDVAVLQGLVTVRGRITRDLVVVNGDVRVEEGGRIDGDVTVIGGTVSAPPGTVGGRLTIYEQILTYTRRGDRIAYERPRRRDRTWRYDQPSWRATIAVDLEDAYNRVEGLPVRIGPVLESRGDNSTRLEALAVWRSVNGFSAEPEDFGWLLRFEQRFGGDDKVAVGATRHSLVQAIEGSGLSELEASLAAALFRRDFRDYYEADGYQVYGRYRDPGEGLWVMGGYRDETHAFAPVGDPWTLWNDDDPWRPQPLVGQGELRSVFGEVTFDRRNDPGDPTDGWHLGARLEGGLEGTLVRPAAGVLSAAPMNTEFRTGLLDLRRYVRLGPSSDLSLRGVVAGSLDGEPLPPQRQHALGGEGSLPGYAAFSIDCGARDRLYPLGAGGAGPVFGAYGCDRIALFQAEYRGSFSIDFDFGGDRNDEDDWNDDWEDWDWRPAFDATPRWTVFADVGRGWALDGAGPARRDTDVFADVGAGFFIGGVGLYWAVPLHGDDHGVNFFLRLDHRF